MKTYTCNSSELMNDRELAVYLKVKQRTVRQWRAHHQLPFIRVTAKCVRFRKVDVDEWLERNRTVISA